MDGNGAEKEYILSGLLHAGIKIHTSKRITRMSCAGVRNGKPECVFAVYLNAFVNK